MSDLEITRGLLLDVVVRTHTQLTDRLRGLDAAALGYRVDADANPIGWLAWHLTRVQDDHLAALAELPQAWQARGWVERFGLPYGVGEHGYGHTRAQVDAFRATAADLIGYADDVQALSVEVIGDLEAADPGRIVDDAWDPPVTLAARLVSVVNEINQHLGQIDYVAGLYERR